MELYNCVNGFTTVDLRDENLLIIEPDNDFLAGVMNFSESFFLARFFTFVTLVNDLLVCVINSFIGSIISMEVPSEALSTFSNQVPFALSF